MQNITLKENQSKATANIINSLNTKLNETKSFQNQINTKKTN